MNEKTKSLIRHALTALGVVLGLLGLNQFTGLIDAVLANLDSVWSAISTLVGFVLLVIGFFKDKTRFDARA